MEQEANEPKTRVRGYSLPPDLIEWLEQAAAKDSRSVSNFLSTVIQRAKDAEG